MGGIESLVSSYWLRSMRAHPGEGVSAVLYKLSDNGKLSSTKIESENEVGDDGGLHYTNALFNLQTVNAAP